MIRWILIFLGGGLGSVCRYMLAQKWNFSEREFMFFPYGTFLANILSCLILGILLQKQYDNQVSEQYRLFLATGFCGGFSTFSTFSYEIYLYIQRDQWQFGIGYMLFSLLGGVIALLIGLKLHI